jgi:YggT family protein
VEILCVALELFVIAIFVRIILSWFPIDPHGGLRVVVDLVAKATDWLLLPLRRLIPPVRIGAMMLDLTPMIVLFGLQLFVIPLVCSGPMSLI